MNARYSTVAVSIWDGRIAPVFDVSREVLFLHLKNGTVSRFALTNIDAPTMAHKVDRLMALRISTLICGAISQALSHELRHRGVQVIGFVSGDIDEVVRCFLAGKLPTKDLAMPGCWGRRQRLRAGRGRAKGRGGAVGRHRQA